MSRLTLGLELALRVRAEYRCAHGLAVADLK